MTSTRETLLFIALLACLALGVAISGGAFGGLSDLESFMRASQPVKL